MLIINPLLGFFEEVAAVFLSSIIVIINCCIFSGVENFHAAIKQNKILQRPLNHKLLHPIGTVLVNKLQLDKRMAHMMRANVIYNIACALFTISHKKFNITYARARAQNYIADIVKMKLNRNNPLDMISLAGLDLTSCPKITDDDFIHVKVKDLDTINPLLPFELPLEDDHSHMISFTGGPYKYNQAMKYLVALRKLELQVYYAITQLKL